MAKPVPGRLDVGLDDGRVLIAISDGYRITMDAREARRIGCELLWGAELLDCGLGRGSRPVERKEARS
jgi:hypothetical protein